MLSGYSLYSLLDKPIKNKRLRTPIPGGILVPPVCLAQPKSSQRMKTKTLLGNIGVKMRETDLFPEEHIDLTYFDMQLIAFRADMSLVHLVAAIQTSVHMKEGNEQ